MTFKDLSELRSLSDADLHKEYEAAKKHLDILTFENSQGNLKDTSQLKKTRRYIAHTQMLASERKNETKKAPEAVAA